MNIRMLHDQLVSQIKHFARDAQHSRQVYRRLNDLLPDRLDNLVQSMEKSAHSSSDRLRQAYASAEFSELIEEVVSMGATSLEARVQYETHMMLIDARRTLRRISR